MTQAVHPNRSDFNKRHPGSGRRGQQCRRSYRRRNPLPFNGYQKRIDGDEAHRTLKRRAGAAHERGDGLGRSARARRVRAAPGFTTREEQPRTERGRQGSNIRDVDSSGMEGRGYNSSVDAWKDVRWHELASCEGWCD